MLNEQQRRSLKEASEWYVQLCDSESQQDMTQDWQQWLAADEHHRWAWQRVDQMQSRLQQTRGPVASHTLEAAHYQMQSRRTLLKGIASIAAFGFLGFGAYRYPQWRADYASNTGEIKHLTLADKTRLTLNTASSVNVSFDDHQRRILLLKGEIMITTGHPKEEQRPLVVQTPHGELKALGTRFAVSLSDHTTRLQVYDDKVELTQGQETSRWQAGQQVIFNQQQIVSQALTPGNGDSWTQGMLVVNDQPLDHFLQTLSQYRRGVISIDPTLNQYRISGGFRIDDTDQALAAVVKSFPVEVSYLTPYWVRVRQR